MTTSTIYDEFITHVSNLYAAFHPGQSIHKVWIAKRRPKTRLVVKES